MDYAHDSCTYKGIATSIAIATIAAVTVACQASSTATRQPSQRSLAQCLQRRRSAGLKMCANASFNLKMRSYYSC